MSIPMTTPTANSIGGASETMRGGSEKL